MDVAVFCLALMGTDYPAFLREAHRVLRPGGRLWIAEVLARNQRLSKKAVRLRAWHTFSNQQQVHGLRLEALCCGAVHSRVCYMCEGAAV